MSLPTWDDEMPRATPRRWDAVVYVVAEAMGWTMVVGLVVVALSITQ